MKNIRLLLLLLLSIVCMTSDAQSPSRLIGAITAVHGSTLTVKTDAGETHVLDVPPTASLKRIAPGQKDLSAAETIEYSDLEVGDRALVKLDSNATAGTEEALQIIAIKQEDVAQKQKREREDWQHHGVGGLVKSVDTATGNIVLGTGYFTTAKTVLVHTTQATILKRYATNSISFDAAKPAPITAIHTGDQLRVRGQKSADATEIAAEEVVSGSFRSISGTIVSLDIANASVIIKDLTTKKPVTVRISADVQMRRLPERMAQMMAARLKGSSSSATTTPAQSSSHGGGIGSGDPQQMLNHAPAIQLSDLVKGEAVMVVSTDGSSEVTAITLLAGIEPLLEAPAASQNLLSNWSMNSSASEAAAQ